jgi:antitoxin component of MazEF toxin-antitoxin module
MVKTLTRMGNSYGVLIERPIMELLHITPETQFEISVLPDGQGLSIKPIATPVSRSERVRQTAKRVMQQNDRVMKKLAE